ncbi:hypothetical protein [Saliphagus infecundisoli]|uniref:Uncharacterized protein n=1 Tax=Saliphagus infecundisoli TaxID=1849069 RepID=A0ABD5QJ82_9EURY|nr:hypothetical protein [Saliphagus infecundisoli]
MVDISPNEDQVADYLINHHRETCENEGISAENIDIQPERPYDHYSNRGSVDLFVKLEYEGGTEIHRNYYIYEIKSHWAIRSATGANEIIRQYNRMREYFFKGTDYNLSNSDSVYFQLVFTPSAECFRHFINNYAMYREIIELVERESTSMSSDISFCPTTEILDRSPIVPVSIIQDDILIDPSSREFWQLLLLFDESLADEFRSVFNEYRGKVRKGHQFTSFSPGRFLIEKGVSEDFIEPTQVEVGSEYSIDNTIISSELTATLKEVANVNGITINQDGAEFVAGYADGNAKKAIDFMETVAKMKGEVTMDSAYEVLSDNSSYKSDFIDNRYNNSMSPTDVSNADKIKLNRMMDIPKLGTYADIEIEISKNKIGNLHSDLHLRDIIHTSTLGLVLGLYDEQ